MIAGEWRSRGVVKIGGQLTAYREPPTANGRPQVLKNNVFSLYPLHPFFPAPLLICSKST